jgi:hypothetical protein
MPRQKTDCQSVFGAGCEDAIMNAQDRGRMALKSRMVVHELYDTKHLIG